MKKVTRSLVLPCAILLPLVAACSLFVGASGGTKRSIGLNFFVGQCDWAQDRLFADAMKTAREWTEAGRYGSGAPVAVDADGWPLSDAETTVWHGIDKMNGTYRLQGECASRPTVTAGHGGGEIRNFSYSNGVFAADFVYSAVGKEGLLLTFANTGGGVRNVKLMRPLSPGSARSYPVGAVFTDVAKNLVRDVGVVRFMWAVDGWNGPWQTSWSDRVSPSACSFNRGAGTPGVGWAGKGIAWEYAIEFCNQTGKDMWINMPLGASDEYVEKLAALVKAEYDVPDGKIYWEYSNEATWDGMQVCASYLRGAGLAEAESGGPVGYDGSRDANVLSARYYAARAARMSLIWRRVWGDQAMMARVRPVACGQLGYDTELVWGLEFVDNWFANGDGSHVSDPHPVNYFFYGCGGSHYTGDDPDALEAGVSEISAFESFEEEEACLARMYGLERCAYEGGVWTDAADYRLDRIEDAMVRYHELWDKYGGGVLTYYVTSGGEDEGRALGFTLDGYDLDTPKFRALARLRAGNKPSASAGKLAPCVLEACDFSMNSVPWLHPAPGGAETLPSADNAEWAQFDEWRKYKGYLFRTASGGTRAISLEYRATEGADLEIMVDGVVIAKGRYSGEASPRWTVSLSPGLHAIRVKKNDPGYFLLEKVRVD